MDHDPVRSLEEDLDTVVAELTHAGDEAARQGVEVWTESAWIDPSSNRSFTAARTSRCWSIRLSPSNRSELTIVEAVDGADARPGHVYLAPSDRHLRIDAGLRMILDDSEPIAGHRPAGDILLESLARHAPERAVGIVLSGMGSDGTSGLAAIHRAGGVTMVQDRDSSIVYGMPQSCIDLGVAQRVVPLDSIARSLVSEVEQRLCIALADFRRPVIVSHLSGPRELAFGL